MKQFASIFAILVIMSGVFVAENASAKPKKAGKHSSHKKAKKSKSGYFYNFQH